jgi:UDP-GlcNAc3NAcA epimerase
MSLGRGGYEELWSVQFRPTHNKRAIFRAFNSLKILTIIGARPQFIKASAVSHALREAGVREVLLHTGQHYDADMSKVFFDELNLPEPNYHFSHGGGSHGVMTGAMMTSIEPVVLAEKPDWVLVYGDTNSTLAGALVASKLHVPVAHVEAGLRSFNRAMPEEINRICTDHVSDLLFCSSSGPVKLLANEGISKGVHEVGDVMADSLALARLRTTEEPERLHRIVGRKHTPYALMTLHRAENTENPVRLRAILDGIANLGPILLPLHPRTAKALVSIGLSLPPNVKTVSPLGYLDMVSVLSNCERVLTDSGGLQKEAWWARKPCVTLRDETEWTETVAAGWNLIVGADSKKIQVSGAWTPSPFDGQDPYGGEGASGKIAAMLHGSVIPTLK